MSFIKATNETRQRLICSVAGKEKTGKTSFSLSAPGPIYYCNFDIGLEGVIERFLKDKDIFLATYRYNAKDGNEVSESTWLQFKRDFTAGLKDGATVVVDTWTEAWELCRLARFGKLTQVMPHMYGKVNAEARELVRESYESDANVIFVHKVKPVYINDRRTGDYEPAGFADMPYLVQANLRTSRDEDNIFHLEIKDCRQNMGLAGCDYEGEMVDFQIILDNIFGG